jgi:MoaA/NifB/PqqE/SkfB family radical SAM enzyme
MVASIALVQPSLRVSRDFIDYPYHSDLAVVQVASILQQSGFDLTLVDGFAMPESDLVALEDNYVLLGAPNDVLCAAVEHPELILIHYTPFHRPPARDPVLGTLLDTLRTTLPDVPMVLADLYQSGEHYIEAPARDILAAYPEVDVLLKYQAEEVVDDLCKRLIREGRPATPQALTGPEVSDLNTLPLPAWGLVDLEARDQFMVRLVDKLGRGSWAFPVNGRTLPAISSRGCPYRCSHCSSNPGREAGGAKRQRRLDQDHMVSLIGDLAAKHGATRIDFLDEMVNVDVNHFDALLTELGRHEVTYDFPNGMRADWVRPDQLARMAGRISTLSVSAESGVQRVVDDVVGKALALPSVESTVAEATRLGISTLVHFIIGMPGETRRDINQTLEYAVHLHQSYGAWPAVQYATPLPGTRLADDYVAKSGGNVPAITDFNPLFQHHPVTSGEDFDPDVLRQFKWTFDQRIGAGLGPQKVIMNVTYRCNNRCNFCAVGNRTQLDGQIEDQKEILLQYREQGLRMVDFDGGEPTLYEQLVPLVRYCKNIGYSGINVTTNGRMCAYPDYARRLVNSGLTTLLFSVHGPDAETHARQVGVQEAFDQTVEGIRHCVKHAPPSVDLGMNITLTKTNHDLLPDVTQLAWDLGLKWLNIQFLTPFGRATTRINPDTAAAAKIAMGVIDEWRDRMKFQVINLPFCFMPGYEEFILGDLLKIQRHMVFVNNEGVNLYDYLRERRSYEPECYECPYKVFCGGFYGLEDSPEPPWDFTFLEPDVLQVGVGTGCSSSSPKRST